jgi:hypothetical protein
MTSPNGKSSKRRFSKWLVGINCALAWGAIYLAIIYLQAAYVAATGFAFIGAIAASYMGVGHFDYRAFIKATAANAFGYMPGQGLAGGDDFPLVDTSSQNPEAR